MCFTTGSHYSQLFTTSKSKTYLVKRPSLASQSFFENYDGLSTFDSALHTENDDDLYRFSD